MKKLWLGGLLISILILAACGIQEVEGSGKIETRDYNVSGYNKLVVKGKGIVTVIQDNQEGVTINTDANLLEYLIVTLENETLEIKKRDNISLDPSNAIRITVHVNTLQSIEVDDVVDLLSDSIVVDELNLTLNHSGRIDITNLTADSLTVNMDEVSQATVAGKITTLQLNLDKFSKFDGNNLTAAELNANLAKNSEATVWVTDSLTAEVNNLSSLSYYGDPANKVTNVASTAKLEYLGLR